MTKQTGEDFGNASDAERMCPCCGGAMVRGYVVISGEGGKLDWHKEYPAVGFFGTVKGDASIMKMGWFHRQDVREASHCNACGAVLIDGNEATDPNP